MQAADARKAFMALAYTKFKNAPLYLEWAPENAFKAAAAAKGPKEEEEVEAPAEDVAADEEPGTDESLYQRVLSKFSRQGSHLFSDFAPLSSDFVYSCSFCHLVWERLLNSLFDTTLHEQN